MSGVKQTIRTSPGMKEELHQEAARLRCSISYLMRVVWHVAGPVVKAYPATGNGGRG